MNNSHEISTSRVVVTLAMVILSALFIIVSACGGTTSPKTSTLSGYVLLQNDTGNPDLDPVDFSGVRVSLYALAEVDSIIQNAKSVFNTGGFPLSQNSEFDHRTQYEYMHTFSAGDGSFSLLKVPYGEYNIVISKEGWGYKYSYNILINDSQISIANRRAEPLLLYPEVVVSGSVEENIEVANWHHLVISGDVTFSPSSSLIIRDNGVIRIEPGKKLDVLGAFYAEGSYGSMFRVTSNVIDSFATISEGGIEYLSFNLGASTLINNTSVSWGVFGPSKVGLAISNVNTFTLEKCRFKSDHDGFLASVCNTINVRECLFTGTSAENSAVNYYMVETGDVIGNICIDSRAGILLNEFCKLDIMDNVFVNNEYGIEMFNCNPQVSFNYFRKNDYGIRLTGRISPVVERNYIDSDTSILIGYNGYYPNAIPSIHYNNMVARDYFFYLRAANTHDIDARNNYYYTTSIQVIEDMIYDKYDYPEGEQYQVAQIIYNPFSQSKIVGATPRI